MRHFFAVLLIITVLFGSGCSTVPETGRRQLMLISSSDEARMGLASFAQIKQEEKLSQDVEAIAQVQRVGQRIARSVGRELPDAQWEFAVFESDQVNAFALPGGKVGVYTGLLKLVSSDDELAAVIGHEIAHVTSRHGAERVSQNFAVAGVGIVAALGMEAREVDPERRNLILGAYGLGTTVGLMLPYSRLHETEADAIGLRFAAGAGYDPRASISFWRKMQESGRGSARPPTLLSTHPSPEDRIRNLQEIAPKHVPLYEASRARIAAEQD